MNRLYRVPLAIVLVALAAVLLAGSGGGCDTEAPETRAPAVPAVPYPIVSTMQDKCYSNLQQIAPPLPDQPFYGQDAQHPGAAQSYRDNGDGTISDLVTGLMWQKDPGAKFTCAAAVAGAAACRLGGYTDWRLPTIK